MFEVVFVLANLNRKFATDIYSALAGQRLEDNYQKDHSSAILNPELYLNASDNLA